MSIIDSMTEQEAKDLLNEISDTIGIGSQVRSSGVILANLGNALRRSSCLSRIENYHTVSTTDEDDEECLECPLSWGQSPDEYIETYKEVINNHEKNNKDCEYLLSQVKIAQEVSDKLGVLGMVGSIAWKAQMLRLTL